MRKAFKQEEPGWITTKPTIEDDWNACIQTLSGSVKSVTFSHDSKLLASASWDGTVKVWDAATGSLQQSVTVNGYITSLLFDIADSILTTNIGRIKVDRTELPTLSECSQGASSKGDWQGLGISGSWITWNARNLLWLPSDYRAVGSDISQSRSTVAIGCESGKVFVIGFSLAVLSTLR